MEFAYNNPNAQSRWDDSDYAFSKHMFGYWMNFVKYGDANGMDEGAEWQTYRQAPGKIMELGEHIGMIPEPNQQLFNIFNGQK